MAPGSTSCWRTGASTRREMAGRLMCNLADIDLAALEQMIVLARHNSFALYPD